MRYTVALGGLFTSGGMFLSSFFVDNINVLYLTYAVMYGIGAAFTYSPSLAVLGHYFDKYLGKVSGFATTGSSVFTAIMPFVYNHLLVQYGLTSTLRIIATLSCLIFVCAMIYEGPVPTKNTPKELEVSLNNNIGLGEQKKAPSLMQKISSAIYKENWKKKRYIIWVLAITISQLGYFIPYVYMSDYIKSSFPDGNPKLPVACIGVASGVGRILFGFVADMPKINRILMHQIAVALVGVMTMILSGVDSYGMVIVCILALGLCDGCYVSLMGPIAIEICGPRGASQAIGFLLGFCSIPLTLGPVFAGFLLDRMGSYSLVFLISGISPILATAFMFLIRCVNDDRATVADTEAPTVKSAWDNNNTELHSLTKEPSQPQPVQGERSLKRTKYREY